MNKRFENRSIKLNLWWYVIIFYADLLCVWSKSVFLIVKYCNFADYITKFQYWILNKINMRICSIV